MSVVINPAGGGDYNSVEAWLSAIGPSLTSADAAAGNHDALCKAGGNIASGNKCDFGTITGDDGSGPYPISVGVSPADRDPSPNGLVNTSYPYISDEGTVSGSAGVVKLGNWISTLVWEDVQIISNYSSSNARCIGMNGASSGPGIAGSFTFRRVIGEGNNGAYDQFGHEFARAESPQAQSVITFENCIASRFREGGLTPSGRGFRLFGNFTFSAIHCQVCDCDYVDSDSSNRFNAYNCRYVGNSNIHQEATTGVNQDNFTDSAGTTVVDFANGDFKTLDTDNNEATGQVGGVTTDIIGNSRGATPTIGAWEAQGAGGGGASVLLGILNILD